MTPDENMSAYGPSLIGRPLLDPLQKNIISILNKDYDAGLRIEGTLARYSASDDCDSHCVYMLLGSIFVLLYTSPEQIWM